MLTKERLQEIFHSNTTGINGVTALQTDQFEEVFALILNEQTKPTECETELKAIASYLVNREKETRHHYSSRSILEKLEYQISEEERQTRAALAEKRQMIEDALVYFRSVVMIAESIGMAGTHAEKSARLRGLIELLNSAITKLRNQQQESLLNNWDSFHWGYSDYPYRRILEKFNDMYRENKGMKKILEENNLIDKLPF